MLKAIANKHRLLVLCELIDGERSVSALQDAVPLSQSALSQHLGRLRDEGLVATRREAQTIYYSLASEPVRKIMIVLYDVYCSPPRRG